MKRIYFTAIPLQSNFVLEPSVPEAVNFELKDQTPRRFPIIRIMAQTMQPGDEAVLVIVRQQNDAHNPNYDAILEEAHSLHLEHLEVKDLPLAESQNQNVVIEMFRSMLDVLENNSCYYSCMTFGTKTWPLVLASVLNYAEKVLENTQVKGIYYQEALRENGQIVRQRLYDMSVLFSLNSVVDMVAESDGAGKETAIRMLLEGC